MPGGGPELEEILERGESAVGAVEEGVEEEEDEELVVHEGHAVVYPRAVVVHLEWKNMQVINL